jgi:ADP-heptose synthase, bifunctional sugar kinase/adenylyltransferase
MSGLGAVDWVVGFDEDTPERLLEEIRPDVLVKGGDYRDEQVVGGDIVREYGGSVKVLTLVEDLSTSEIVDRIKDS